VHHHPSLCHSPAAPLHGHHESGLSIWKQLVSPTLTYIQNNKTYIPPYHGSALKITTANINKGSSNMLFFLMQCKHCKYSDPMWQPIPIPFKSRHFQQPIFVTLLPSPFISTASRAQAMHFRKRTAYDVFLTHHKAAAALSARLARVGRWWPYVGGLQKHFDREIVPWCTIPYPYIPYIFVLDAVHGINWAVYIQYNWRYLLHFWGAFTSWAKHLLKESWRPLPKKDGGQLWFIAPVFARLCCFYVFANFTVVFVSVFTVNHVKCVSLT